MEQVIIGVVLGFALSLGGTIFYDWWKDQKAKRSLASTLFVEVVAEAHWAAGRASLWNVYEHSADVKMEAVVGDIAPKATVYESVAGRVDCLGAASAAVIAFFGALEGISTLITTLGDITGHGTVSRSHIKEFARRWRAVCILALSVIQELEKTAMIPPMVKGEKTLAELKADLETVAGGGVLSQKTAFI